MSVDEFDRLVNISKIYINFTSNVTRTANISLNPYSDPTFYVDFQIGNNIFDSLRLSDLTIDRFFNNIDYMILPIFKAEYNTEYNQWKKLEIRNYRLKEVLNDSN